MIKIIETSTSEREEEFHQKYNEFKHYYTNTDMLMKDIWQRVGLTPTCSTGRRIREQLRHDGHDPFSRGQKLKKSSMLLESLPDIQRELRNGESIDETLRKHNLTLKDAVRNMEKSGALKQTVISSSLISMLMAHMQQVLLTKPSCSLVNSSMVLVISSS